MFPRTGLHGLVPQKIELFMSTAESISNPTLKRELYTDLMSTFAAVFPPSVYPPLHAWVL
jgi:hypothetical protein